MNIRVAIKSRATQIFQRFACFFEKWKAHPKDKMENKYSKPYQFRDHIQVSKPEEIVTLFFQGNMAARNQGSSVFTSELLLLTFKLPSIVALWESR